MPLTQDEIDGCRDAFLAYDKDHSGSIEVWELKEVLEGGSRPGLVQEVSREFCTTSPAAHARSQPWDNTLPRRSSSR